MSKRTGRIRALSIAIGCVGAVSRFTAAHADPTIWQSDWTIASAPLIVTYPPADNANTAKTPIAFGDDGDILLGGPAFPSTQYQFVRMAPDGTLRWATNIGEQNEDNASSLISTADGGALIAFGGQYLDNNTDIAKIDSTGFATWAREIPSRWLAVSGSGRIAAADCGRIDVLDGSGNVMWEHFEFAGVWPCESGGASFDGNDNVYAVFPEGSGPSSVFRLIKFDSTGEVAWNVDSAMGDDAGLVGAAGEFVFVRTASDLRALQTSNGSVRWSVPIGTNTRVALAGTPAEPVVAQSGEIVRLAGDTGVARWTQSVALAWGSIAIVDDALVVGTATGATKLDAGSGAIQWSTPLPTEDSQGRSLNYSNIGGLDSGSIVAAAKMTAFPTPPPFLQRIDFTSGALGTTVETPDVEQTVAGFTMGDDSDHLIGVGVARKPDFSELHLRRLDAADGSALWESVDVIDGFLPVARVDPGTQASVSQDAIAVVVPLNLSGWPGTGAVWVALHDRATGARRWQTAFRDLDQGTTYISAPAIASDGSVFVAAGASVPCNPPGGATCGRQTLYKLSAADGSLVWRFDNDTYEYYQIFPQTFSTIGSDALIAGPFNGANAGTTLLRLAGSDGSIQWASNVFADEPVYDFYRVDDGNVIVVADGWAKLDPDDGSTIWVSPTVPSDCTYACYTYDAAVLDGGDLIFSGQNNTVGNLLLLSGDGSGTYQRWNLATSPTTRSAATRVRYDDSSGRIWVNVIRRDIYTGIGITTLAQFDRNTGTLLGEQIVNPTSVSSTDEVTFATPIGAPRDDRMISSIQSTRSPQPSTSGAALFDTSVLARGDLSMAIDVDASHVTAGSELGFHLTATYSGDAPIADVRLVARLPWSSGISDLQCAVQGASGCSMDGSSGNLHASFDLMPGGTVDITGRVRVLEPIVSENAFFSAFVYGPVSLLESDANNNIASRRIGQSLFFGDFEQR